MWWPSRTTDERRRRTDWPVIRHLCCVVLLSTLTAGCFQPLYGERTLAGDSSLRQRLSAVEVAPIAAPQGTPEARIAVELRNALIFDLTGGAGALSPTHRLIVQLSSARESVIVDITTSRPDVEGVRVNASYNLVEIATGRSVAVGRAFGLASFDIPGQQQRFAGARGQRDAQDRAVQVIAESIRSRLASYFVAGT